MIEKMNHHYSMTNPATVYDEEALTALELVGRTTAKVNETVEAFNTLEKNTGDRIGEQDMVIENRMKAQDDRITEMNDVTLPQKVTSEVQKRIDDGSFEQSINAYAGDLEGRLNNLLGNVNDGATTRDAEVMDVRARANGLIYENAGSATRAIDAELQKLKEDTLGTIVCHELMQDLSGWSNGADIEGLQGATYEVTEDNRLIWTMNGQEATGNPGIASKLFTIQNPNNLLYVDLDFECNRDSVLQMYIAGQYGFNGSNQATYLGSIPSGNNIIKIRPSDFNFDIHTIWIVQNGGQATENTYTYTINKFRVYQNPLIDEGLKGATTSEFVSELYKMHRADSTRTDEQIGYSVLADKNNLGEFRKVWTNVALTDEEYNETENCIEWTDLSDGGVITPELTIDTTRKLRIEFDLSFDTNVPDEYFFSVVGAEQHDSSGGFHEIQTMRTAGHYKIDIDPAYFAVYHNTNIKRVWFMSHLYYSEGITKYHKTRIENVKVYQSLLEDNGYPDNLAQAIVSVGSGTVTPVNKPEYMVSPDGSRYVMQIANDGSMVAIPVNPSKAFFLGNSLLNGFNTFGMSASDSSHDFYYLVNEAFKTKKSGYTASKLHGYGWESAESLSAQTAWMDEYLLPELDADLDLVVVQLGDNVNTAERESVFAEGCKNMLRYIRTQCPRARVVWMGAWYQNQKKMNEMVSACTATGSLFVNIWDLHTKENESAIGNTYTDDDGVTHTIDSEGVASHPGDSGMKAIANRLLHSLGFTDDETFYE